MSLDHRDCRRADLEKISSRASSHRYLRDSVLVLLRTCLELK